MQPTTRRSMIVARHRESETFNVITCGTSFFWDFLHSCPTAIYALDLGDLTFVSRRKQSRSGHVERAPATNIRLPRIENQMIAGSP